MYVHLWHLHTHRRFVGHRRFYLLHVCVCVHVGSGPPDLWLCKQRLAVQSATELARWVPGQEHGIAIYVSGSK